MRALCDTLEYEGYLTQGFTSGREAIAALREQPFDLLLTDLTMPDIDGIALLRACREIDGELACIVMTGQGTIATAVDALKTGALDYVLKPFKVNTILPVLARALATRSLQLENIQLRESVSIHELSRAITQGLEHGEVVERTLAAAGQHSYVSAVYLLVPTDDGHALRLAGKTGSGAEPLESAALLLEGSGERWVDQARKQLEAPGDSDPRVLFAHPFDARIGVALPIVAGGKFFGVLGFSSSRSQQRISPGQIKALEILARTAATAFETAALVTQLRRVNEELELRVRERTRELEIANRDLEAFSYSVSHDLREPLRAVEGFCEMFRAEFGASVPEPGRRILQRIWSGASRMTQLVNDLLHFSRFSREPLHCLRVPLREIVLQTVARLKEPLGERQPSVQVGDLPDCFGDRSLLEQVLINLLSNAFKFSAGRDAPRIEVGALRQGEDIVYYVRDNGVGFDMRYADKLFGVFQRLHPQEAFEGTGIGLSIVHRIITRHGGRVWADSHLNEGTTLYFSLPAQIEAPIAGFSAASAASTGTRKGL
jgi:signal transduction histidine kinase/CheY-like chemotaxis protein